MRYMTSPRALFSAETGTASAEPQAAPQPATETEKKFGVSDLEKKYFAPDNIATDGAAYLENVASLGLDIRTNFNPDDGVPQDMGLYVIPLQRRADPKKDGEKAEGNITIGVAVCAVPSIGQLQADNRGDAFILGAVLRQYETKIIASIRPRSDGKMPPEGAMPKTLDDFVENRREVTTYGAFSDLAKVYVPELKKKMAFITPVVLRQCFQSKAYAQSFPAVSDEFWIKLLDVFIAKGNAKKLDVSVLVNWKETRDEAVIDAAADVNLDELLNMDIG